VGIGGESNLIAMAVIASSGSNKIRTVAAPNT
jgi:hypothetical protein